MNAAAYPREWVVSARGRESAVIATLVAVYIGVLYYLMIHYVAPTYAYRGFTYRSPDPVRDTVVILAVVVLALLMPRRVDTAAAIVVWMHFVFATMPSMLVPQFTSQVSRGLAFQLAMVIAAVWLVVIVIVSSGRASRLVQHGIRNLPKVPRPSWTNHRATSVLTCTAGGILIYLVAIFGLSGHIPELTNVRDVRLTYRTALAAAPPGTAYVLLWMGYVLNPLVIMRGLLERRWVPILVGAVAQTIIYATAGYKMVALSLPAVLVLYAWNTRPAWLQSKNFFGAVVAVMVVAWGAFVALGSSSLALIFVLRTVVAPGNLAAAYLAIFHDREPLYWSYSFMSRFIDYPYATQPNFLVGDLFRHDPAVSANVNMFGDGYMSMRWDGIVLEAAILVGLLLVLNGLSARVSLSEIMAVLLLPSFALCNSNIFTAFLTDGFLAAIVLFYVMPARTVPADRSGRTHALVRQGVSKALRIHARGSAEGSGFTSADRTEERS